MTGNVRTVVAKLARVYKPAPMLGDPLHIVLWENIGYLIDDERRAALFAEFEARVGLSAAAIARAPRAVLIDIAKRGGMNPDTRVERWRAIAKIVIDEAEGDLRAALKAWATAKARTLLKKFPAIGDPGADKVLLFAGLDVRPALESNGVRTMLRLSLCVEGHSYAASYKAAVAALSAGGEGTKAWFITAYSVLRAHGQALCKRAAPLCAACPVDASCGHVRIKGQY